MRLLLKEPEAWSLADVEDLVSSRIPEGQRIEYKRELHLDNKSQKAELAKDVSGFANAQGGVIVFGVDEEDSEEPLPTEIVPLTEVGLRTRLENVLDSTLEPVPDYRVGVVDAGDGTVLVVSVKAHGGRPVMVQGYGEYRYFRRSGTRTRPMTGQEVASAHANAERREQRLDAKLTDLPLIAPLGRDDPSLLVERVHMQAPEPAPIHSVIVASLDGPEELIGPQWMKRAAFPEDPSGHIGSGQRMVRPYDLNITAHGLMTEHLTNAPVPHDDQVEYRFAIYRAGVIEWVRRYAREFQVPSRSLAEDVHNVLHYAGSVFETVGYGGGLAVWVRIDNAQSAVLATARDLDMPARPAGVDAIVAREQVTVAELVDDPMPVLRRSMDRIWQGFGHAQCLLFDEDGMWISKQ